MIALGGLGRDDGVFVQLIFQAWPYSGDDAYTHCGGGRKVGGAGEKNNTGVSRQKEWRTGSDVEALKCEASSRPKLCLLWSWLPCALPSNDMTARDGGQELQLWKQRRTGHISVHLNTIYTQLHLVQFMCTMCGSRGGFASSTI